MLITKRINSNWNPSHGLHGLGGLLGMGYIDPKYVSTGPLPVTYNNPSITGSNPVDMSNADAVNRAAASIGVQAGVNVTCGTVATSGPFNYVQNLCTIPGDTQAPYGHDAAAIVKDPLVFLTELQHPYNAGTYQTPVTNLMGQPQGNTISTNQVIDQQNGLIDKANNILKLITPTFVPTPDVSHVANSISYGTPTIPVVNTGSGSSTGGNTHTDVIPNPNPNSNTQMSNSGSGGSGGSGGAWDGIDPNTGWNYLAEVGSYSPYTPTASAITQLAIPPTTVGQFISGVWNNYSTWIMLGGAAFVGYELMKKHHGR